MWEISGGSGETYRVNEAGEISRRCMDWKFSGGWKAQGLVQYNNFGRQVSYIPFRDWDDARLSSIDWTYKNGKPRYTLRDLDHGTTREWGEMVYRVRLVARDEVAERAEAYARRVAANPGNWGIE
jgi:hypothetical protein